MSQAAAHDPPPDFRADVAKAAAAGHAGDLSLLAEEAGAFDWASAGRRLAEQALAELRSAQAETAAPHVILFTGHRIDDPGRKKPRFPPEQEATARRLIGAALRARLAQIDGAPLGLAGGANGGDILFLEACAALGIPTELYLALPPDAFSKGSVVSAGPAWERRFRTLVASHPQHRVLAESEQFPVWLAPRPDYDLWKRNNLWMLHHAVAHAGENLTLIALWDGQGGDGPGGTEDMVRAVERRGAETVIIDTKKAFNL